MPWYTYVCQKCGETLEQKASIAYRDVMPVHRGGACGDGRLRRLRPALGPGKGSGAGARERRALEVVKRDGAAEAGPVPEPRARAAAGAGEAHGGGAAAPRRPADPGASWEDCILEMLSTIMTESLAAPRRVEVIWRLLATLPSLSLKLRVVEAVARSAGARPEVAALVDALATEIAVAPVEALTGERRLLDLLLLALRHEKLAAAELERRLADDRVMVRLLRSAVRWAPEGGADAAAEPPFLAWSDLRQLAGAPRLRARIQHLAAHPIAGDAWDRLVIAAAAAEEADARPDRRSA